jgi:hypothetical protein
MSQHAPFIIALCVILAQQFVVVWALDQRRKTRKRQWDPFSWEQAVREHNERAENPKWMTAPPAPGQGKQSNETEGVE